jgi:5-(carboxyamino)imidazole ribonucleotide mutase
MGLGKSGAANSALLAVQILSLSDPDLKSRFESYRRAMPDKVKKSSEEIKELL